MRILGNIKRIVLFLTIVSIISCSNDDSDMIQDNEITGTWQRSDSSDTFEFKLYFFQDNTGYSTYFTQNTTDKATSSAIHYNWNIDENLLTIESGEDIKTTTYSFNSNGQLILNDFSDFPFDKVE